MVFKGVSNGGNCNGCGWVMAQGKIVSDTPGQFKKFAKELGYAVSYIKIHSEGGDLSAALELGRMFREQKSTLEIGRTEPMKDADPWHTSTDGRCLSACAYAFLGGYYRDVPEDSELGFHQFFDADILSNIAERAFTGAERLQDQYVVGVIINYLIEMGVSTELYPLVASTSPGDMQRITKAKAVELRIDNIADPLSSWKFLPFGKGLVAQTNNSLSGRRIRLYCSSGGIYHLAFFFPNNDQKEDGTAKWGPETLFTENYKKLKITVGDQQWPSRFNLFTYTRDKSEMVFVFDIPKKAALEAAANSRFAIYPERDVPRVHSYFFGELGVANVDGDARIPQIALRNCI